MSAAGMSLVDQARAIEHPLPVSGVSGLYGLELGGRSVQVSQAQLDRIRAAFSREMGRGLDRVNARIAGGVEGHRDMIRIHEDQFVVSRISDVLGRVDLPDISIWDGAYQALWRGRADLRASHLGDAARDLEQAESSSQRAYAQFTAYREGTIAGAGRAVTGLEVTRDVSFATAGILATVATGGAAGAVIGAGITATGTAAQQAMEVHLDLRREVDWAGIGFDAVIGLVTSKLGGALGESVAGRIVGNPAVASLGRRAVARIVSDLVAGRAGSILHMTVRNLFDNVRGSHEAMNMGQFLDAVAHQLTDPRSAFMDLLNGEMARRVHTATSRRTVPPEGSAPLPEPTRRTLPEPAAPETAAREGTPPAVPKTASGLELDTSDRSGGFGVEPEHRTVPLETEGPSLELDRTDRSGGFHPEGDPANRPEWAGMGRVVDLGPAGKSIPLDRSRTGPKTPARQEFGAPSQERGGSEHRSGMHFHEWNAAEIERGLRIDYDPIAGRPRKVTYRVDADVAGAPGSDPRSYTPDVATSGAQSRDAAYTGSGYERGHLAQLEAFKGGAPESQEAANLFTNLVPMTPELNRGFRTASGEWQSSAWRESEHRTVNEYAPRYGSVTVEIEPVYSANPQRLPDGTPIPIAVRRRVIAPDGTVLEDASHLNR